VAKFVQWYRSWTSRPRLSPPQEVRGHSKEELEKTLSLHPDLSDKEKRSLEALTSSIINKILHEPLTLLKRPNGESAADLYLDSLQTPVQNWT